MPDATDRRAGRIKGVPMQYVRGHGRRGKANREWVVTEDGCWEWNGRKNAAGYGRTRDNGKLVYAHRFMYEQYKGPIPEGTEIDHLCRNRGCVNPDHLEAVSHQENMARGYWGAKTHCPHGHPYSGENLGVNKVGHRFCRTCWRERERGYKQRRREQAAA